MLHGTSDFWLGKEPNSLLEQQEGPNSVERLMAHVGPQRVGIL